MKDKRRKDEDGSKKYKKIKSTIHINICNMHLLCLVPENLRENAREKNYKGKVEGKKN